MLATEMTAEKREVVRWGKEAWDTVGGSERRWFPKVTEIGCELADM